jgi:hypothetical protein
MCSSLRWLAVSVFVTLMAVSPVLADVSTGPNPDLQLTVATPGPAPLTALQPASTAAADATALQLRPVQIARTPFNTLSTTTLLPAGTQAVGFRMSGQRADAGMGRRIHWAIAGAAIGAIVGAIDDDPLGKAAIGAVVGFGLSYVVRR